MCTMIIMIDTILQLFSYDFMIRALLAGVMIALTAPVIGTFLVIRRFSLVADTLSHIALAGVAISILTGGQPVVVTVIVTVLAALLIECVRSRQSLSGDAVLAMFLPGGLALSIVLLSLAHGLNASVLGYLFGSITTVRADELVVMALLGTVTWIAVVRLYDHLLYASFDEAAARVGGVNVPLVNSALMVLTAVTVSIAIRVVGVLLIGALMVIPVVTAMQIARSFKQTLAYSILFALIAVILGLIIAYVANIPAGGAIVLLALFIFGVVSTHARIREKKL